MEYTKGKWVAVLDEERSNKYQAGKMTRRYDIRSGKLLIATVWAEDEFVTTRQKTPTQQEQDANVRVIATAKELLSACEAMFTAFVMPITPVETWSEAQIEKCVKAGEQAKAAIAAAKS